MRALGGEEEGATEAGANRCTLHRTTTPSTIVHCSVMDRHMEKNDPGVLEVWAGVQA